MVDISERNLETTIEQALLADGPDAAAGGASIARETRPDYGEPGGSRRRRLRRRADARGTGSARLAYCFTNTPISTTCGRPASSTITITVLPTRTNPAGGVAPEINSSTAPCVRPGPSGP